jgi:hypothetical protein
MERIRCFPKAVLKFLQIDQLSCHLDQLSCHCKEANLTWQSLFSGQIKSRMNNQSFLKSIDKTSSNTSKSDEK